jgi:hypothetical protein
MEIKKVLVGFTVVCAMTQPLQAAEAPTRGALEKMFVMREVEWAAQECTHTIVETDLLWDEIEWRNPLRLVLEGRAIQDIWIRPRRPAPSTMYGTTLRIFDPRIGGWHIIWADPLNQDYSRQIGRAEGKDIVQIGDDLRGLNTRWRFTEITANSFHWIGEERSSESDPWQITYEHFARRTNP